MIGVGAGLHCPACNSPKTEVTDSRVFHGGIRRRRRCMACKTKISTIELPLDEATKHLARVPVVEAIGTLAKLGTLPKEQSELVLTLIEMLQMAHDVVAEEISAIPAGRVGPNPQTGENDGQ